jgi:hypothetical protein
VGLAPAGTADIVGCMPDGQFLAIEVKRPGGKFKPYQLPWLETIRSLGGLVLVVHSVQELLAAMLPALKTALKRAAKAPTINLQGPLR